MAVAIRRLFSVGPVNDAIGAAGRRWVALFPMATNESPALPAGCASEVDGGWSRYASKTTKMWDEIVRTYESDGLFMAECAGTLVQNVNYEMSPPPHFEPA